MRKELFELDPALEDDGSRKQLGPGARRSSTRLQEDALFNGQYDGGDALPRRSTLEPVGPTRRTGPR